MRYFYGLLCVAFLGSVVLLSAYADGGGQADPCCNWTLKFYVNSGGTVAGGDDDGAATSSLTVNNSTGLEDTESAGDSDTRTASHSTTGELQWYVTNVCANYSYKWKASTSGNFSGGNRADAAAGGYAMATSSHQIHYSRDLVVNATNSCTSTAQAYDPGPPPTPLPPDSDSDAMSGAITGSNQQPGTMAQVGTLSQVDAQWKAQWVVQTCATQLTPTANAPIKFEGWCDAGSDGTFEGYVGARFNYANTPTGFGEPTGGATFTPDPQDDPFLPPEEPEDP
jgi:hypothetical protein